MVIFSKKRYYVSTEVRLGNHGRLELYDTIRRTKGKGMKKQEFYRSRESRSVERRVFIAQVAGQVWWVTCGGRPMIRRGNNNDPWPTIDQNLEAKRGWIVLVMDITTTDPPTQDMLTRAVYFDCPADGALSDNRTNVDIVGKMEALQEIGRTTLTDEQISQKVEQLQIYWEVSDSIIWNSQHFSLHLGALILTDTSFDQQWTVLGSLARKLDTVAHNAEAEFMVSKHLGCMAGMAVSGVLTFGVGAFAFWAGAGASMGRAAYVRASLDSQICQLQAVSTRFSILR